MRRALLLLSALGAVAQAQAPAAADSAGVTRFLDALAASGPLVCEFVADPIGNFWWSDGDDGLGRVADTRAAQRRAKEAVSRRVTDAGAIRALVARLGTDDPCVRQVAAKMLGRSAVGDDVLGRLLEHASPRVREAALRAAGTSERPALRGAAERHLAAREPEVAAMAAWMLGELELRASVPPLRRALRHAAAPVRLAAAWALGNIEDPAAVPDLEELVSRDADRRVRRIAVEALGELQQARSAPVLVRVLEGDDLELSVAAAHSLGELDGLRAAPPALVRALSSRHVPLRHAAIHALSEFEDPALAPDLLPHIADADAEIRVTVIEMLGELRARVAIPALRRALKDANAEVRRAAIEALAEIEER